MASCEYRISLHVVTNDTIVTILDVRKFLYQYDSNAVSVGNAVSNLSIQILITLVSW